MFSSMSFEFLKSKKSKGHNKKVSKNESSTNLTFNNFIKVPDFGPIEIEKYSMFVKQSRDGFIDRWNQGLKLTVSGNKLPSPSLNDYDKLKVVGAGSFGRVYLVKHKSTRNIYAMKAIAKFTIMKYKQLAHTQSEKMVLACTNCPFTLRLVDFFKDNSYIYFVVPFAQGGELYTHLQQKEKFDEASVRFYISQVIMALEYLHFMDIVYRDIKPENILMDHTGYLKLADFGFCKRLTKGRTYSLCGTPEYLAPEVILSKGYGKSVDWWGVGILVYELTAGFTPFKEKKAMKVYERVLKGTYKMPISFSEELKDLIRHTLQADTSKRFGNLKDGVGDFKDHKWFRTFNWQAVACRKLEAPFVPDLKESVDINYFRKYKYESLIISEENTYQEEFQDF